MAEKTVEDIIRKVRQELRSKFPKGEITAIIRYICEDILHLPLMALYTPKNFMIEDDVFKDIDGVLKELLKDKPIQYIANTSYFCDLKLYVDENVLIPRQETEELIKWIEEDYRGYPMHALDIGTGSGCIGLALKQRLKDINVTAIDVSDDAIRIAKQNAENAALYVDFMLADIFSFNTDIEFDLIVSNPPYVRESEKAAIKDNVLNYEPHSALFVPDSNPLLYYKAIVKFAEKSLANKGKLYVEINECFGDEVAELFRDSGLDTEIRKDLRGKNRFVKGVLNRGC
jgi:release factor glutamine methyltransferase